MSSCGRSISFGSFTTRTQLDPQIGTRESLHRLCGSSLGKSENEPPRALDADVCGRTRKRRSRGTCWSPASSRDADFRVASLGRLKTSAEFQSHHRRPCGQLTLDVELGDGVANMKPGRTEAP